MRLRDVVDELEHVDGLADAGAAEQADLAALRERREQVDDLDAGLEQVLAAGLFVVGRGRTVDRQEILGLDRAALVLRLAEHVHDAAERADADGHGDRRAGRLDAEPALQALGGAHRDRAHDAVAELLLHLERQVLVDQFQRLVNRRDSLAGELHVDHRADDLDDLAVCRCRS